MSNGLCQTMMLNLIHRIQDIFRTGVENLKEKMCIDDQKVILAQGNRLHQTYRSKKEFLYEYKQSLNFI